MPDRCRAPRRACSIQNLDRAEAVFIRNRRSSWSKMVREPYSPLSIIFDPRWMQMPTAIDYRLAIAGPPLAAIIFRADHPTTLPGIAVLRAQYLAPQCSTIFVLQFLFVCIAISVRLTLDFSIDPCYNDMECRCVGIGRRDRLKICYPRGCVGSSPTTGTKIARNNVSGD